MQLRLCHSQHAVRAESVLTREPGLSAPARLYGQTVFTVCVVCVCVRLRRPVSTARLCSLSLYIVNVFTEFHITHGAQVACRGVFSI